MKEFIIRILEKLLIRLTKFDKDKLIYDLWKLLDDIDTASDSAREDDRYYRDRTEYLQRRRFYITLPKGYIDSLYDKYYPKYME